MKSSKTFSTASTIPLLDRGEQLGLTGDELAFYDVLETSESSVAVLGNDTLKMIVRELVQAIRQSVTIDWTVKESVRATLRVKIKRLLNKYGYPPDKRERATATVLLQAETICCDWAHRRLAINVVRIFILEGKLNN